MPDAVEERTLSAPEPQMELTADLGVPDHGPGCQPIEGTHSRRFPGEPQYVCVTGCPRRRYLDAWLSRLEAK